MGKDLGVRFGRGEGEDVSGVEAVAGEGVVFVDVGIMRPRYKVKRWGD